MRRRIISPLDLAETHLAGSENGLDPFGAYTSMRGDLEAIDFDYTSGATAEWAAGAMVSSAMDVHALLSAVFAGRVISDESLAEMTAGDEYGLGIFPVGDELFGHDGWMPGYATVVLHGPRSGMTAFWVATHEAIDFSNTIDPSLSASKKAESRSPALRHPGMPGEAWFQEWLAVHQRSRWTTSSKGRLIGLAIGASGRSSG